MPKLFAGMEKMSGLVDDSSEGAEGERRRTANDTTGAPVVPDPEMVQRARRRRFGAEYKFWIVCEADRCEKPGEVGALLRREGLYSSLLSEWRRARDVGALEALTPVARGPRPMSAPESQITVLRGQLERSQADLQTARRVIEVQGNVSALLEDLLSKSAIQIDEHKESR